MSSNPAASDRSAISPGEKIGPYCVESEIGAETNADVLLALLQWEFDRIVYFYLSGRRAKFRLTADFRVVKLPDISLRLR